MVVEVVVEEVEVEVREREEEEVEGAGEEEEEVDGEMSKATEGAENSSSRSLCCVFPSSNSLRDAEHDVVDVSEGVKTRESDSH